MKQVIRKKIKQKLKKVKTIKSFEGEIYSDNLSLEDALEEKRKIKN